MAAAANPPDSLSAEDEGARQYRRDAGGQLIVARGVDHEHVEIRVILSAKRLQTFLEPPTWVIGDHHGDDRRDLLLRHQGHHATAASALGTGADAAPVPLAIVSRSATRRSGSDVRLPAGSRKSRPTPWRAWRRRPPTSLSARRPRISKRHRCVAASHATPRWRNRLLARSPSSGRDELARRAKDFDATVAQVIKAARLPVEPVIDRLPEPVRVTVEHAREARDDLRKRVFGPPPG